MYLPLKVEVESNGEDVDISIGTFKQKMQFETAISLAIDMDEAARMAKLWSGNTKRMFRGIGTLHDASNPNWINEGQPFTPNGVPVVNKNLTKRHDLVVYPKQGTVVILFKKTEVAMPYAAALQISQWIRVKAKESQQRAGDKRHWSKVA